MKQVNMRPGFALLLFCVAAAPLSKPLPRNGISDDPAFFPLAVWVQQPANAARYKELGINTYLGLWRGPTQQQLDDLQKSGMRVICHQNQLGLASRHRIAAWMHGDEPDNAQSLGQGKGYGPPIAPEKIVERYQRMKTADPDRPVLLNLGQGVAWDGWHGRGVRTNHPEDYPQYLKGCDIASFDIYPATHDRPQVAGNLWYVAQGVQRLVKWTEGSKPVWCCIETTHINNAKVMPTPKQVKAEVWMAIIHGATGIIYFAHEFQPRFIEAGLLAYPEMSQAVQKINTQIHQLAPVLNSAALKDAVVVSSSDQSVPISILCKQDERAIYVFAVAMRDAKTTGTFTITGKLTGGKIEVVGENRSIEFAGGTYSDNFEGYGVHLYKLPK